MLKILKKFWAQVFFVSLFFFFPKLAIASQPHYTLIINQVRGTSCCDPGSLKFLENQVEILQKENLTGVFAVRFDALTDPSFSPLLQKAREKNEMAALLEITPDLATKSGVAYHATGQNWYEAAHVYLLGYSQEDRRKLIDTYMQEFKNFFGFYPTTSVGWMIDTYSLQYLHENYNVLLHEITREQWATDSTSLIGGSPHYPYYPSRNWVLIPDNSTGMPLIIRQTITDPVGNYGDFTSSHTSQPNDYMPRDPRFSYFEHLFNQAHNQPLNQYTFALVGLENSMPEIYQSVFLQQIEYISSWQKTSPDNFVLNAKDFASKFKTMELNTTPTVYEGVDEKEKDSKAWWITTLQYRARLRLNENLLYLSDFRIYNKEFTDPYMDDVALDNAYWIVPFLLDGSRFRLGENANSILNAKPDTIENKTTRIELLSGVKSISLIKESDNIVVIDGNQNSVAVFSNNWLKIPKDAKFVTGNESFLQWGNLLKLSTNITGDTLQLTPSSNNNELERERTTSPFLLLPKLTRQDPEKSTSTLYVNNRYSVFDRNPIRLVYYPRDKFGYPVSSNLIVSTIPQIKDIAIGPPDAMTGTVFIDLNSDKAQEALVHIQTGSSTYEEKVYFSPNCKNRVLECISHPKYLWWYLNTFIQTN